MTMSVNLFYNPRCSKSRQALQLLESNGVNPIVVEYLKHPPNEEEIAQILDLLGLAPRELMRTHEQAYKAHNLDDPGLSHHDLIRAMVEYPILIERPIVLHNGKAVIGRPPEKILEIL
jgi:arsenate reductase